MHIPTPRRRRAVALAALATSAALAVSACGGSSGGTSAASGPVEITVSLFGTFGYQENGLFAEYEKAHPGITIKYDSTQSDDKYWPALQTRLTSGKGASDVQGIEVARISDVVTNQPQLWTDLRDTPAGSAINRYVDWKEKAATTKDGAVLGLGTDIGPMAICYRSDLLGAAGLPTEPAALAAQMSTWQDYAALGQKYKAATGKAWVDSASGFYNAIVSTEQKIYYDEGGKVIASSNPAVKSAFDTAAAAGQAGLTARFEQFVDPGWDAGFGAGTFATIACPSWMIGYIKGKAGDAGSGKWNVTSLPGGKGGNWGGSYLGIPAASPHKKEAAELISWLTAPEQQVRIFNAVGNFPSTKDAISQVSGATDKFFNNAPIGKIYSAATTAAPVQILGPEDGVIKKIMSDKLLSVEANNVPPADAWNAAVQAITQQVG
ncbi:ABC transporter substrate-binding protein [Pseudonocardia sp. CA-107938]|uniref:ABC transporter substrate-binding protein n=1 Tax=Pseudonocardia sp. CA-107938 TaxID=3240021 RepID=UPI003D8F43D1